MSTVNVDELVQDALARKGSIIPLGKLTGILDSLTDSPMIPVRRRSETINEWATRYADWLIDNQISLGGRNK